MIFLQIVFFTIVHLLKYFTMRYNFLFSKFAFDLLTKFSCYQSIIFACWVGVIIIENFVATGYFFLDDNNIEKVLMIIFIR